MIRRVVWSIVELDYLKKHCNDPVNQLCIQLSKSRSAVQNKLKEIAGHPIKKTGRLFKTRSKIGKRTDCNNLFFRSTWEANTYRLLRLDESVTLIEYEPEDFGFWKFGHVKGTVSYTPDFRVTYSDGRVEWIEVKGGFMKAQDKVKLRRFQKYYPEEFSKLVAVTPGPESKTALFFKSLGVKIKWLYPEINKKWKTVIPHWE